MMSAVTSAENGNEVILLEKMEKLGKKLLITGKGRCNITNSAEMDEFMKIYQRIQSSFIVVSVDLPTMTL